MQLLLAKGSFVPQSPQVYYQQKANQTGEPLKTLKGKRKSTGDPSPAGGQGNSPDQNKATLWVPLGEKKGVVESGPTLGAPPSSPTSSIETVTLVSRPSAVAHKPCAPFVAAVAPPGPPWQPSPQLLQQPLPPPVPVPAAQLPAQLQQVQLPVKQEPWNQSWKWQPTALALPQQPPRMNIVASMSHATNGPPTQTVAQAVTQAVHAADLSLPSRSCMPTVGLEAVAEAVAVEEQLSHLLSRHQSELLTLQRKHHNELQLLKLKQQVKLLEGRVQACTPAPTPAPTPTPVRTPTPITAPTPRRSRPQAKTNLNEKRATALGATEVPPLR